MTQELPNADRPIDIAQRILDETPVAHLNTRTSFKSTGVTFDLDVWLAPDERASELVDILRFIEEGGYELEEIKHSHSSDNIWVQAEASTEEE